VALSAAEQDPSDPALHAKHRAMGHGTVCRAFPGDGHSPFHPDWRPCEAEAKDVHKKGRSSEIRGEVALEQVWKQSGQLDVERRIN